MYLQSDKASAVKEIQKYLFFLSDRKYKDIPRIPIDGTFDKETQAAVIKFQEIKLLSPTGIVDYETFTALYADYNELVADSYTSSDIIIAKELPLKENDQGEAVRALHVLINELKRYYPQIGDVGNGAYFSARTTSSVKKLRELFRLSNSEQVDSELYRRIVREIRARENFPKNETTNDLKSF